MQREFEILPLEAKIKDVIRWAQQATREREFDIEDYNNQVALNSKVYTTIPSSSTDTIGTEKVGDLAADTNFLYVVVDNSGTLEWRRVAIASF